MRFATVCDFKTRATQYLKSREEICITRRGKPVAMLAPVRPASPEAALIEMSRVVKEAGISRKEMLFLFEEVRKDVYKR